MRVARRSLLVMVLGLLMVALPGRSRSQVPLPPEIGKPKQPKKDPNAPPAVDPTLKLPPEEIDPNPPKTRKRIIIEDEGPPPVTVPRGAYYSRLEDLFRAANEMKFPAIKDTLLSFGVGYDRFTDFSDKKNRVCPVPLHRSEQFPVRFGVFLLSDDNAPRNVKGMDLKDVKKFEHFEELALAEAKKLGDVGGQPTPYTLAEPAERYAATERLLAAVLTFHDTARDLNKRRGKGWEQVKTDLADALAAVRAKRLRDALARKDWAVVRTLASRMATLYPNNLKLQEEVAGAKLVEAEAVVATTSQPSELERA
ncbi:MAG: hypothetical protein ACRCZF_10720, partial [Gemmataceae bacterium]